VDAQTMTRCPRATHWADSRRALWIAFGTVHAWLTLVGVVLLPRRAFYDVDLYRHWIALGLGGGPWPVLDGPSVYPAGALLPMLVPAAVSTTSRAGYALGWCVLVTALDAVAVQALARRGSARGAWWWIGFLVLLGPVAMGRTDAIIAPLVIVVLLVAARRPRVAAVLVTVGAWIKVAPGVLIIPLLLITRRPVRDIIVPAALVCVGVVASVTVAGGLPYVASFLSAQDSRGLQVEAVAATPWVLAALVRHDVSVVLNVKLCTWEVIGPGTAGAARALDVLLPLAVAGLAVLLWRARSRPRDVLVWGSLAFAVLLIVVNKVGSPQYVGWLAPPVAVALATCTPRDRAAGAPVPAIVARIAGVVLVIATLTQVVFPLAYNPLLAGNPIVSGVLVARNVGLLVLLGWVCAVLARDETPDDLPAAV
jgi:Glycosyltransferase family 87